VSQGVPEHALTGGNVADAAVCRRHAEGHFAYWTASAACIDRHLAAWRRALG
jgi:hypothetical protein